MPFQRRHAFARRHVTHLERRRLVRPPKDALPVRKQGKAMDLRRRHIIRKVLQKADAATHAVRVPFQRRHAFAGRRVPHLQRSGLMHSQERSPGHDAPTVRRHGNAPGLRRRHIITKVLQKADAARRTTCGCPSSVATHLHLPVATSHTLIVLSFDADTTRRPSGNTATLLTYEEDRSSQKYSGRRNARPPSALAASPRIRRSPRPTP